MIYWLWTHVYNTETIWQFDCEILSFIDDDYIRTHHYFPKDLKPSLKKVNGADSNPNLNNVLTFNMTFRNQHYLEEIFDDDLIGLEKSNILIYHTY